MRIHLTRALVVLHRWLGIALSLFVAAWFASGMILIYVPFPSLPAAERIASRADIPLAELRVSPSAAIAALGGASALDGLRLVARGGRPVYLLHRRNAPLTALWADDGRPAALRDADEAAAIAAAFSNTAVRAVEGPFDVDQWVVHQAFDEARPFFRVALDDPSGAEVYVSQRSGEVVQRTRRTERVWNYFGAVVHWIYPSVLRRHWAAWDQLLWWLALAGLVVSISGLWLGIARMRRAVRAKTGRLFPYHGWLRWHHMLGVFTGVFVFTWMLSGWLSMDHGRLLSVPTPRAEQIDRLRGLSLADAAARFDLQWMRAMPPSRELGVLAFGGRAWLLRQTRRGTSLYAPGAAPPASLSRLPDSSIAAAVARVWPDSDILSVQDVAPRDTYTRLRNSRLPESAVRLILDDKASTWVHVDAATGRILSIMDRSRRLNRWLFNGLHSLDFPGFSERRPLWDVVILALLTLGLGFSVTGVYISYAHLRRPRRIIRRETQ